MTKTLFVFTQKDLVKLVLLLLFAVIFFGLTGLFMMLFMKWMTWQSYAQDAVDKHGISSVGASRLGGVAVLLFTLGLLAVGYFNGFVRGPDGGFFEGNRWFWWIAVICCGLLGLVEDLRNDYLSPRFRLCSELTIFSVVVGALPYLIPIHLGVPGLDALMSLPILGWLITTVFCVGFVNSINMADGANGLVPGMMTVAFSIMFLETDAYVYGCLMTSCGLFTVFNIISGRLFLGDAGAYALGAILALSGLHLFSEDIFSAGYLACLFAYPCIDFISTLIRRLRMGRSIFSPDNDHLHNRIHYHLRQWFSSKTLANSMTGTLVVALSSGLAIVGYFGQWWSVTSELWAWLFLFQCFAYGTVFYLTGVGRSTVQYVVPN